MREHGQAVQIHTLVGSAPAVEVRPAEEGDLNSICSWVGRSELELISGERGTRLAPGVLSKWLESAHATFLLTLAGERVAFATCSSEEWRHPIGTFELCHLVVAPQYRRLYHGSFFCHGIARSALLGGLADRVVGRVVPRNSPALALMNYLRWNEIPKENSQYEGSPFHWFEAPDPRPRG